MAHATSSWPWASLPPRCSWVVTEKIHGANLCLVCDGKRVRVAKRRDFIAPDEAFFGFREAVRALNTPVLDVFRKVSASHPDATLVWVYVLRERYLSCHHKCLTLRVVQVW